MNQSKYQHLDEACKHSEINLSQLLTDRKKAISQLATSGSYSTTVSTYHHWAEKLYAAVLSYARAANPAITARVLALPRELRDSIYMYLWEPSSSLFADPCTYSDPRRDLLYWWEHFDSPWMLQGVDLCNEPCSANLTDLRPPHFVDAAFVGREFAREVLKRFQESMGRDLRPSPGGGNPVAEFHCLDASLRDFVAKDALGVGYTMEELARNLDLRIAFQCDAVEESGELVNETEIERDKRLADKYLAELDEGVAALLSIPYTERTIIHDGRSKVLQTRPRIVTLVIRQESIAGVENSLNPILNLVGRAYSGLKDKGFTVKIQYHSDEIGLKVMFDDDVWAWTDEDWRKNVRDKNESKVEPEERNPDKLTVVWGYLRKGLFQHKQR